MTMKIIDLSPPLYDGMPVYPGDPEVEIKQVHTLEKEGWRLRTLSMPGHIGSHVDAFSHMDPEGKTLSEMPLTKFFGQAVVVKPGDNYPKNLGLVFSTAGELGVDQLKSLTKTNPPFVVVGNGGQGSSSMSVELEKGLLKSGIVTFTDLINLDKLPKNKPFMFYGLPLNIRDGDGSPIRAVAMVE